MAKFDLLPRRVCLIREEDVPLLDFVHDMKILLNFVMLDAFAADRLGYLDEAMVRAIEADYCIPTLHVTLKAIELVATLHDPSLRLGRLRVRVLQHMHCGASAHLFSLQELRGLGCYLRIRRDDRDPLPCTILSTVNC